MYERTEINFKIIKYILLDFHRFSVHPKAELLNVKFINILYRPRKLWPYICLTEGN